VTLQQVTDLTDATPPPHYGQFVAEYQKPVEVSFQQNKPARRHAASPNRATRFIDNAELFNPPFVRPPIAVTALGFLLNRISSPNFQDTSCVRVSGSGSVRQTVSSAGNSVNYTLTAALQNPRLQQPPVPPPLTMSL
jgi:hypothetical protein